MTPAIEAPVAELPELAASYQRAEAALGEALAGLARLDPRVVAPALRTARFYDRPELTSRLADLQAGRPHLEHHGRLSSLVSGATSVLTAADRLEGRVLIAELHGAEKAFWWTGPGMDLRFSRWALGKALGGAEGPGTATLQAPEAPRPAPSGVVGLLGDVSRVEGDGRILVTSVLGADGVTRWVVSLPGIQSLGSTSDPQDLWGALRRELGDATSYNGAVVAAMTAAGVPPGAQVMLVGHSYGGMTAVSLASDPQLTEKCWHVAAVVTAGSPVRSHAVPPGTQLLTIEGYGDPVPAVDLIDPGPWAHDGRTEIHLPTWRHDLDKVYLPALTGTAAGDEADAWLRTHAPEFLAGTATSTVAVLADGGTAVTAPGSTALLDDLVDDVVDDLARPALGTLPGVP